MDTLFNIRPNMRGTDVEGQRKGVEDTFKFVFIDKGSKKESTTV